MPTRYQVRLSSLAAQQTVAIFDDWNSLTVEKRLNNFSTHTISFNSRDDRIAYFSELDFVVEVYRSNQAVGLDWYQEYIGFHRTGQFQITPKGEHIFTSYGRSLEDLLRRRSLAYRAPYLKNGPADDVMKAFVNENGGPGSVAPPRLRNGVIPLFTVAPNLGQAPVWAGQRSYRNVLEVLQDISAAVGVDFAVEVEAGGLIFRTYYPQKGIDRTITTGAPEARHVFAPEFGNMANPFYTKSRTEEATVVIVTGSGTEGSRVVHIETSPAATDSPFNDIEVTYDARSEATAQGLQSEAIAELVKNAARENLTFEPVQTPASQYGVNYNMGDLITAKFGDANVMVDKKILGVTINVAEGKETLRFDFGDVEQVPTTLEGAINAAFAKIIRRLRAIEFSNP